MTDPCTCAVFLFQHLQVALSAKEEELSALTLSLSQHQMENEVSVNLIPIKADTVILYPSLHLCV